MEYEEGESLSGFLARHGGFLSEPLLLNVFLPVLNGLQAVHDAGLLHLDIKPDNIYLRRNGVPMLIDFGSTRQRSTANRSQKVALTPGYAALEQYPGHGDLGPGADVYSMGATLYRCITGQEPVDARERENGLKKLHMDRSCPPCVSNARTTAAISANVWMPRCNSSPKTGRSRHLRCKRPDGQEHAC